MLGFIFYQRGITVEGFICFLAFMAAPLLGYLHFS